VPIFNDKAKNFFYDSKGGADKVPGNFKLSWVMKKLGIACVTIADYGILSGQLVLGIKRDALEALKHEVAGTKPKRTRTAKSSDDYGIKRGPIVPRAVTPKTAFVSLANLNRDESYGLAVQELVQDISDHLGTRYDLVTNWAVLHPNNKNIMLFWIMESEKLAALQKRGFIHLKDWGFPKK